MTSISELARQLADLRARDPGRRIFGAGTHRYRSERVLPSALAAFEAALGVRLPEAYRAFLEEVGHGAGPYCGLWSPARCLEELRDAASELAADGIHVPVPADAFPLRTPAAGAARIEAPYPPDGAIPIAHHGCTMWSLLVTAGPAAGTVWDVACYLEFDGEYLPATRPVGIVAMPALIPALPALASPPTFVAWYAGWLERASVDLDGLPGGDPLPKSPVPRVSPEG